MSQIDPRIYLRIRDLGDLLRSLKPRISRFTGLVELAENPDNAMGIVHLKTQLDGWCKRLVKDVSDILGCVDMLNPLLENVRAYGGEIQPGNSKNSGASKTTSKSKRTTTVNNKKPPKSVPKRKGK